MDLFCQNVHLDKTCEQSLHRAHQTACSSSNVFLETSGGEMKSKNTDQSNHYDIPSSIIKQKLH